MKTYKDLNELMNEEGVKTLINKIANKLAHHYHLILITYWEKKEDGRLDNEDTYIPLAFSQAERSYFFRLPKYINDSICPKPIQYGMRVKIADCNIDAIEEAIVEKARAIFESETDEDTKKKITLDYLFCELEGVEDIIRTWNLTE